MIDTILETIIHILFGIGLVAVFFLLPYAFAM